MQNKPVTRRFAVQVLGTASLTLALPGFALADPFESQPLHQRARVLRQTTLVVPAAGSQPGVTGADVNVQARGIFGIDWVIAGNDTVTLLLLSEQQKSQLVSGRPIAGDPLMRFEIEGPETAGHSVNVMRGNYYVAFLNRQPQDVRLLYRTSLVPY